MSQQSPPYARLDFFLSRYSPAERLYFFSLWGVLIAGGLLLLVAYYTPHAWTLSYETFAESAPIERTLERFNQEHLALENRVQLYTNFFSYKASPLEISKPLLVLFAILSAIGWAVLLAASSRIGQYYGYLVYAFFGLNLYLSRPAELFFGTDPYALVSLGLLLGFLIPAYLFQEELVKLRLALQTLFFLALELILFGSGAAVSGWQGFHQLVTFGMPAQAAIAVLFILVVSKEPVNLLIYLTTNQREQRNRQPGWLVMGAIGLLVGVELLMALQYTGYLPLPALFVTPLHIFLIVTILIAFLAQNGYFQVKDIFDNNLAYCATLMGMGVLSVSYMAYHFGSSELFLRHEFQRLIAALFFLVGFMQLIYLGVNFWPYLRARQNIFYVLYLPPHARFFAVWLLALSAYIIWGLVNPVDQYPGYDALRVNYRNLRADNAQLRGMTPYAISLYRSGHFLDQKAHKASYNFARLKSERPGIGQDGEAQRHIAQAYRQTERLAPLPAAAVNYSNFMRQYGQQGQVLRYLRSRLRRDPNAYTAANIAGLYFSLQQPDSAVHYMKQALRRRPADPMLLSNMGGLYQRYERRTPAGKFLKAALREDQRSPFVLANAYPYFLRNDSLDLPVDVDIPEALELWPYSLNRGYYAYRTGHVKLADSLVLEWIDQDRIQRAPAYLLRITTLLGQDSVEKARDIGQYFSSLPKRYGRRAHHQIGAYYYRQGVPEMASQYFQLAANFGSLEDQYYASICKGLAGRQAKAYDELGDTYKKIAYSKSRKVIEEQEMMSYASGEDPQLLALNFSNLSHNQAIRMARYAGVNGNIRRAVNALDILVQRDSSDIEPYLELAQISLDQEVDSLEQFALVQVKGGIRATGQRQHPQALFMKGQCHVRRGDNEASHLDSAQAVLQRLRQQDTAGAAFRADLLAANLMLARGDTAAALELYQALHPAHPLDERIALPYLRILKGQGRWLDAMELAGDMIDRNDQAPRYWAHFADCQAQFGMLEDAIDSIERARKLAVRDAEQKAYKERLAALKRQRQAPQQYEARQGVFD